MPKVAGILIETTFGSIVEIVLFIVLIVKHKVEEGNGDEGNMIPIIQAAILGSILTNLLLCLGLCFFMGGMSRNLICCTSTFLHLTLSRHPTAQVEPEVPRHRLGSWQRLTTRCSIRSTHPQCFLLSSQVRDSQDSFRKVHVWQATA